jgi:hypothetical protein
MREEAEEAERRCTEVAEHRDGKKTAILVFPTRIVRRLSASGDG